MSILNSVAETFFLAEKAVAPAPPGDCLKKKDINNLVVNVII